MYPELFHIPFTNIAVHSYGLMLVIGLLLAMELSKFLARRSGLNDEHFATAAILALVSGLIGARIFFVLQMWHKEFNGGPLGKELFDAVNITSGGLVYYGGFLVAIPTLIGYAIWKKIPILRGMDIVAPCVMIGLGFGRIGCFLNGCCEGAHCELPPPLTVTFPYHSNPYITQVDTHQLRPNPALLHYDPIRDTDRLMTPEEIKQQADLVKVAASERSLPVIDTQLMSTITALMIAGICVCYFSLGGAPGRAWALMMMLEGPTRALLEGMRVEPLFIGRMTLSMFIGIMLAIVGAVMWFVCGWLARNQSQGDAEPVGAMPAHT